MLPQAQQLVLGAWLLAGLLCVGTGQLVRRAFRADAHTVDDLLLSFWLGWAVLLIGLQLWHLVFPVDDRARIAVATVGVLGLAVGGASAWRPLPRRALRNAPALVAVVLIAWLLSNLSLEGARFGDTGSYYVPTIAWILQYPIVIGLGNLYAAYAYNQSHFLYAAVLEGGPLAHRSLHVANSLLLLFAVTRSVLAFWRLVAPRRRVSAIDVFYALLLPAQAELATGFFLTSTAPDFAVSVWGMVASGQLISLVSEGRSGRRFSLLGVGLLAAVGPTLKLSAAGLALPLLITAVIAWLHLEHPTVRVALGMGVGLAVIGLLALAPWAAGNVLLSGCPLFPSATLSLPVAWRVNLDVQRWIQSTMFIGDLRVLRTDPWWVAQRLQSFGWAAPEVLGPVVVGICGVLVAVSWRLLRGRRRGAVKRLPALVVLPPVVALGLCLAYTPVPRYAGAAVWLFAVQAVMLAFTDATRAATFGRGVSAVLILGAVTAVLFARLPALRWLGEFPSDPSVTAEELQLPSGLRVNLPQTGLACWYAPLPCAPFTPHPGLRLRYEGDLRSGFWIDPGVPVPPDWPKPAIGAL